MSIYVMAPVLRAQFPDVPATAERKGCNATTLKLVALALADSANEDGTGSRPGVRTIADFAQCHTDTVVRALAVLVELGVIHRQAGGRQTGDARRPTAVYDFDLEWLVDNTNPARGTLRLARGPAAQTPRPSRANPRGPEPRAARGPEPRTSVSPLYVHATDPVDETPKTPTKPPWQERNMSRADWLREQKKDNQ